MILQLTVNPADVLSYDVASGKLTLKVHPGCPSLPVWAVTTDGKIESDFYKNPAKDSRHIAVSGTGRIMVGK